MPDCGIDTESDAGIVAILKAKAIRARLNPQFLWVTPDDTLIRELFVHELFYHDDEG